MRRDTAGHEIAKGDEKEKQRNNAIKTLAKAKDQEASKNGRYVWDQQRRGFFFTPTQIETNSLK